MKLERKKLWYLCFWKNILICIFFFIVVVKMINVGVFDIVMSMKYFCYKVY